MFFLFPDPSLYTCFPKERTLPCNKRAAEQPALASLFPDFPVLPTLPHTQLKSFSTLILSSHHFWGNDIIVSIVSCTLQGAGPTPKKSLEKPSLPLVILLCSDPMAISDSIQILTLSSVCSVLRWSLEGKNNSKRNNVHAQGTWWLPEKAL